MAAALLAGARSIPGVAVGLAAMSGAAVRFAAPKQPDRDQVSLQPIGKNPRPKGIELLVVDLDNHQGGHGDEVSYVANSHTDKTQDIETLLLKDNLSAEGCKSFDDLILISKMKSPPEVIAMSVGISPATVFAMHADRVQRYFIELVGSDMSKWSPEVGLAYQTAINNIAKDLQLDYDYRMEEKCEDGTRYSEKRVEAFNALTSAGVTLVLAAGNDGRAENILNQAGLDATQGIFKSKIYSNGEILPAGVIVVGGSQTLADGSVSAVSYSNPNPAVDVLAASQNIQVNRNGTTSSGTSLAAPQVAALAANILAINPRLKPADVEKIITSTATPLDDPKGRTRAGVINEEKALEAAKESLSNANS